MGRDYEGDEDSVGFAEIDAMIGERAQAAGGESDDRIERMLGEIENKLKQEKA